jgi:hypothetical protein
MAGPKITSVVGLKQYMMRKLGSPVVNIEITDDQLQDAVDDTLDDFTMTAYSGVVERCIPIALLPGVNSYILPYDIFAVLSVNSVGLLGFGTGQASNMFSMNQFVASDLYKPGVAKIDMVGFELINEMIETMNIVFSAKQSFDYNSITKTLHLFAEPREGDKCMIQVYRKLHVDCTPDPASAGRYLEENLYDEKWVKRMAVARAQLQWGKNLMKYTGSVLPNGGTLNADKIYDEAKLDVEALTTQLHEEYALPADFYIG